MLDNTTTLTTTGPNCGCRIGSRSRQELVDITLQRIAASAPRCLLQKTVCTVLALGISLVLLAGARLAAQEPPVKRYEKALLELGALPVEALRDTERRILETRKGLPVDYQGWLSPLAVVESSLFSAERRRELRLPATEQEVVNRCSAQQHLLDVKRYLAEHDPFHLILMHFLLEIMHQQEIQPSDLPQLISIFRSDIGLDDETTRLLYDRLSWQQAGVLYRETRPRFPLSLMPKPGAQETEYLAWLKTAWADEGLDVYDRWFFGDLLVQAQPKVWLDTFLAFSKSHLAAISQDHDIFGRMLEIGTAPALDLAAELLITSSSPRSQEVCLLNLIIHPVNSEKILDAVLELAGKLEPFKTGPGNRSSKSCEVLKNLRVYLETIDPQANPSSQRRRAIELLARLRKALTPEYVVMVLPPGKWSTTMVVVGKNPRPTDTPYEVITNRLPVRKRVVPSCEWPLESREERSFDFSLVVGGDGHVMTADCLQKSSLQTEESMDLLGPALAATLLHWEFVPLALDGQATPVRLFLRLQVHPEQKQIQIEDQFPVGSFFPGGMKRFPCDAAKMIQVVIPAYLHHRQRTTEVSVHCITDIYGRVKEATIAPGGFTKVRETCLRAARQWIIEPAILCGIPKPLSFSLRFLFPAKP